MFALWLALLGTIPDPNFTESSVTFTDRNSTSFVRATDGTDRFFVATRTGAIRIVENGVLLPEPFATIPALYTPSVCGLLGMAIDPEFADNHYVYAFVCASGTEEQILRLTDHHNIGTDLTPIITGLPGGEAHNGGGIGFGFDGKLYFSIGDTGVGAGVDGDLTTPAAKLSRATPTGEVPMDNPYVDGPGPNADLTWARGLRNPFSLTVQPSNGAIWVADVGSRYEQVFVVHAGDHCGWNDYENNQPAGYLTPAIKYKGRATDQHGIVQASRANDLLTITTDAIHLFRRGEKITLADLQDASFNGNVYVASTSSVAFTAEQSGPDAATSGGTATTQYMGATVTGGMFYDGTDFPPEYRGNYFFIDYTQGEIFRAVVDPATSAISKIDTFATGILRPLDLEVGFDGALYLMTYLPGQVMRLGYNHTAQKLILSNTYLRLAEGGHTAIGVRLALPPAGIGTGTATVSVARASGDSDVQVETGATLYFTAANYAIPQPVTFFGAYDFDLDDDAARIEVSSPGISAQEIEMTVRDFNQQTLLVSDTRLEITEGETAVFTVQLAEVPPAATTVSIAGTSEAVELPDGALTFDAGSFMTQMPVRVVAKQDDDGEDEHLQLIVSAEHSGPRTIDIVVHDDDLRAPAITSTPPASVITGMSYSYHVEANGNPAPSLTMPDAPSGASFDPPSATVTFVPDAPGRYDFTIRAANGIEPDAEQNFAVEALEDAAPTVAILEPKAGATVSGTANDWYGSAGDDLGVVRVEFAIDGALADTQTVHTDRYLYKGSPVLWDTTSLSDGAHTLAMTAFDASGHSAKSEIRVTVQNGNTPPQMEMPADTSGCGCTTGAGRTNAPSAELLAGLFAMLLYRNRKRRDQNGLSL